MEIPVHKVYRLPDFFAVGPPRTGTTWLHFALKGLATLPNGNKETRFLDRRFEKGLSWYAAHFEGAAERLPIGEIAPTYFYSEAARERLRALVPHAKIICSFREPVSRIVFAVEGEAWNGSLPMGLC